MISNKINNFIDVPFPSKEQEWQTKRSELISEFITSERQFAQHLYHFINDYQVALEDAQKRNLIRQMPPVTTELFSKIQPIYQVTLMLLTDLNEVVLRSPNVAWDPATARIGASLVQLNSRITTVYSNFAVSYTEGMNALQQLFESEPNINLAILQSQENVGITIFECLQAPMSHISLITDYELMLLEVTPREHNDRENLVSAYISTLPIAKTFHSLLVKQDLLTLDKFNAQYPQFGLSNQCVGPRTPETVPMNTASSQSRYLIFHDDMILCVTGESIMTCEIWLFSDCVMISIPKGEPPVLFEFKNIKATPAELPSSFINSLSTVIDKGGSITNARRSSFLNLENRRPSFRNEGRRSGHHAEKHRPSATQEPPSSPRGNEEMQRRATISQGNSNSPTSSQDKQRRPSFRNVSKPAEQTRRNTVHQNSNAHRPSVSSGDETVRPSVSGDIPISAMPTMQNMNDITSTNCADFFTDIDSFRLVFLMAKRRDVFIESINHIQAHFKINGANSTVNKDYPLAPIWVYEDDVTDCMNCGRVFGIVTLPYHCDFCRQVVCKRCIIQVDENDPPIFICKKCKEKGHDASIMSHMIVDYTESKFYASQPAKHAGKDNSSQIGEQATQ